MKLKATLTGAKEAREKLKELKERAKLAAAAGLYVAGNVVMTEAKQRAPIDTGVLRSSGYVTMPKPSTKPKVDVGFGGAAEQYALVQHERTEFRHEVGEAKYLENAINATDVKGIWAEEVERRMKAGIDQPIGQGAHRQEPE